MPPAGTFIKPEEDKKDPPSTFTVGEKEYSQEELESVVGLGEIAKEVEVKHNTKIDKVYPAFTKSRQELKEQGEELDALKEEKKAWEANKVQPSTDVDMDKVREEARKLGIVTKDDFNEHMESNFVKLFNAQMSAKGLVDTARNLEKDLDGEDGRPAFKSEEILLHMQETGIKDPERAYKDKFESEIDQWKEKKLTDGRKKGMTTLKPGGGSKSPKPVEVTRDNLDAMVSDALHGKI